MHCKDCWFWRNSSYFFKGEKITQEGYCRVHCTVTFEMDVCKYIQVMPKKGIYNEQQISK